MVRLLRISIFWLAFMVLGYHLGFVGNQSPQSLPPEDKLTFQEACGSQALACTFPGTGEIYYDSSKGLGLKGLLDSINHFFITPVAEAHHTGVACPGTVNRNICLPQMDRSIALQTLNATGQLTYCLNARASNYPGFRRQVRDILNQHQDVLGIQWIEIQGTYETPEQARAVGCQVQHNMPETHGCTECAAWVHYLNWPVLIEYRWQVGYNSTNGWYTTIPHEVEHIYGLHEHYDDANFRSYRGTYGNWAHGLDSSPGSASDSPTVMDFGTGVYQLAAYDIKQVCGIVRCFPFVQEAEWSECFYDDRYPGTCYRHNRIHNVWWWGIPDYTGREQLWRWSDDAPFWQCHENCP